MVTAIQVAPKLQVSLRQIGDFAQGVGVDFRQQDQSWLQGLTRHCHPHTAVSIGKNLCTIGLAAFQIAGSELSKIVLSEAPSKSFDPPSCQPHMSNQRVDEVLNSIFADPDNRIQQGARVSKDYAGSLVKALTQDEEIISSGIRALALAVTEKHDEKTQIELYKGIILARLCLASVAKIAIIYRHAPGKHKLWTNNWGPTANLDLAAELSGAVSELQTEHRGNTTYTPPQTVWPMFRIRDRYEKGEVSPKAVKGVVDMMTKKLMHNFPRPNQPHTIQQLGVLSDLARVAQEMHQLAVERNDRILWDSCDRHLATIYKFLATTSED